jgi:hypothetical protein
MTAHFDCSGMTGDSLSRRCLFLHALNSPENGVMGGGVKLEHWGRTEINKGRGDEGEGGN